jgi:hypothetical protein
MSKKVYKTAMGKTIDMGALMLQNENVRAVGNMGVNARGDILDSADRVIENKNSQLQKQYKRQAKTNVQDLPVHTGTRVARAPKESKKQEAALEVLDSVLETPAPVDTESKPTGGLAGALARAGKTA